MSTVFAIMGSEPETGLIWYRREAGGEAVRLSDEELSRTKADEAVLIVSGRDVFTGEVELLARNTKQLRTAALYQLEDDLAEPVGSLHLALGKKPSDGAREQPVAVVSNMRMQAWKDLFQPVAETIAPRQSMLVDTDMVRAADTPVIFDGEGVVILFDGQRANAIDAELAPEIVPAMLQEADLADPEYIVGDRPVLSMTGFTPSETISYPAFVSRFIGSASIDLYQDGYRQQSSFDLGFARRWAVTSALAIIAAGLWLGYLGVSALQLERETERLYQSSLTAYRAMFPEESRVVDPHRATLTKLGDSATGSSGSVTGLMSAFYRGLEQVENVEIVALGYNSQSNRLTSSLKFGSYQDRDKLKQVLETAGLSIELGGVAQEDGFLVGQAVIGGAS